jgi:hypothetical protein
MVLIILDSVMFNLWRKGEWRAGAISVTCRHTAILIGTHLLADRRDRWRHTHGTVLEFELLLPLF